MQNVEIRKIKNLPKSFLKIDLAFHTDSLGIIVIKGFRVGPSPEHSGIWVQPPSYMVYGKYFRCFFMETEKVWSQVEDLLITTYHEQLTSKGDLKENLNDEEIAELMGAKKV